MRQGRHCVIQVSDLPRAAAKRLARGIVIRLGVGDGQAHLARQRLDGFHRARQLGREVAQLEQPVRLFLQAAEHIRVRRVQVGRVLGALFGLRNERPLHIDAH